MEGRGTGEKEDSEEPEEGREGLGELEVVGTEGEGLCMKGGQIVGGVFLTCTVSSLGVGSTSVSPT